MEKKLPELVNELKEKLVSDGVPIIMVGVLLNPDKSVKGFEVIVDRPERHNNPEIVAKVPKEYHGIKVFVV
jgi:hypothetical protein